MYKRLLPIFFASIIFSCSKPNQEETSVADTVSNGNTDGDYFVPNADSNSAQEEDEVIEEMIDMHSPTLDICGFSDDGKYFAFTQVITGEGDEGTGSVFIIDVDKNEWATKPGIVESYDSENDEFHDLDSSLVVVRDKMLSKFNIVHHKHRGTDFDKSKISLQVTNLLIDLRVKSNGKDIILQQDKSVPKSRGSVREYRLGEVLTFNDKIVVFVEYDSEPQEGFEGYRYFDRKYIAVTGVLK